MDFGTLIRKHISGGSKFGTNKEEILEIPLNERSKVGDHHSRYKLQGIEL